MIIVICGLPGTGKSTLANILSKKINATILRTDEIRKKLFKNPTYSEEEKKLIYRIMLMTANYFAKGKIPCILDATFSKEESRREISLIAEKNKVPIHFIECICDENIVRKRIGNKKRNLSDANWEIYLKIKKEYEPIKFEHTIIDTSDGIGVAFKKLEEKLKFRGIFRS